MKIYKLAVYLTLSLTVQGMALAQPKKKPMGRDVPTLVPKAPAATPTPVDSQALPEAAFIPPDEPAQMHDSSSTNSLQSGRFGFGVMIPNGGSFAGPGAVGIKYQLLSSLGLGFYGQFGYDKNAKKNSYGATIRVQKYFFETGRVVPFTLVSGTAGGNFGEGNKDREGLSYGAMLGGGVEFFPVKEISLGAEGGIGLSIEPQSQSTVATGTGQLSLNFYF